MTGKGTAGPPSSDDMSWLDEVLPPPGERDDRPRVITRQQARADGIGTDAIMYRCSAGNWLRMAPGLYLTAPPSTSTDRLWAAALHGAPAGVASGAGALAAYGLPVPPVASELVLVPLRSGVRSWGRIQVRPTARLPKPTPRLGPPLAPVARAVADHVVTLRHLDTVQAVVAAAVQRGLCTVSDLAAELEAGPRRGSALFREALRDVGYGAHSVPEAKAGRLLRSAGITGFEQNGHIIVGHRRYVGDLVFRAQRAVLEIDSTEYHTTPADHDRTLLRDQELQLAGWIVLHVKPRQLRDEAAFIALVRGWLTSLAGLRAP